MDDYLEKIFPGEQVVFTDDDVFNVFDFRFIQGDPESALNDIYSLVLTRATAVKLFGNDITDLAINCIFTSPLIEIRPMNFVINKRDTFTTPLIYDYIVTLQVM